jgi:hypothetical protein
VTDSLAASCADLARWLPAATVLTRHPDTGGSTGSGQPGSRPPWNTAAANAVTDAAEGVRRLEASLRRDVTGRPGRRRGGSDANTAAALKAIENLGRAVGVDDADAAARCVQRWTRAIQQLPAVDEAEPWRRVPAACPYCGFSMLRVQARSGRIACLRGGGACTDGDGRPPVGQLDVSQLTGDPLIRWADGLVAP